MMRWLTILFAYALSVSIFSSPLRAQEFSFALYNADRLYDTIPSHFYDDSDFTPSGRFGWNTERYERKAGMIAAVLDSLAVPVVVLRGVENEAVVRDIVGRSCCDYSCIFRTVDSDDGLDSALLYFADLLIPLRVESGVGYMKVAAKVGDKKFLFVVCDGLESIDEILPLEGDWNVVLAGELPSDEISRLGFRNATAEAERAGRGNALYASGWRMRDRIAVGPSLEASGDVFAKRFLLDGRGAPAATFEGTVYRGGAGRRLPVFCRIRSAIGDDAGVR